MAGGKAGFPRVFSAAGLPALQPGRVRLSEAEFSHSLCPDCVKKRHPDISG